MCQENTICVCMGSSCFARGNQRNVEIVESFIKEKGLQATVELTGSHCEKRCAEGPTITLNGTPYRQLESDVLLDILKEHFNSQTKANV